MDNGRGEGGGKKRKGFTISIVLLMTRASRFSLVFALFRRSASTLEIFDRGVPLSDGVSVIINERVSSPTKHPSISVGRCERSNVSIVEICAISFYFPRHLYV